MVFLNIRKNEDETTSFAYRIMKQLRWHATFFPMKSISFTTFRCVYISTALWNYLEKTLQLAIFTLIYDAEEKPAARQAIEINESVRVVLNYCQPRDEWKLTELMNGMWAWMSEHATSVDQLPSDAFVQCTHLCVTINQIRFYSLNQHTVSSELYDLCVYFFGF